MKNIKFTFGSAIMLGLAMQFSCQSGEKHDDASETELTPVNPSDEARYNINQPNQEVINMDTTATDTTFVDTTYPGTN